MLRIGRWVGIAGSSSVSDTWLSGVRMLHGHIPGITIISPPFLRRTNHLVVLGYATEMMRLVSHMVSTMLWWWCWSVPCKRPPTRRACPRVHLPGSPIARGRSRTHGARPRPVRFSSCFELIRTRRVTPTCTGARCPGSSNIPPATLGAPAWISF